MTPGSVPQLGTLWQSWQRGSGIVRGSLGLFTPPLTSAGLPFYLFYRSDFCLKFFLENGPVLQTSSTTKMATLKTSPMPAVCLDLLLEGFLNLLSCSPWGGVVCGVQPVVTLEEDKMSLHGKCYTYLMCDLAAADNIWVMKRPYIKTVNQKWTVGKQIPVFLQSSCWEDSHPRALNP